MNFTDKCIKALENARISLSGEGLVSSIDNRPLFLVYMKSGDIQMFRVVYNGETFYIFKEGWFDMKFNKLKKAYFKKAKVLINQAFV